MATLTEAQIAATMRATTTFKGVQNREAAKVAALVALYYQKRVNVEDPRSVERWLNLMIPRLITVSDVGARTAAEFFAEVRRLEIGAAGYAPTPSLGTIDDGVRKSLLTVGPYAYTNKMKQIESLQVGPQQKKAMEVEAKKLTTEAIGASVLRHAQAGARQTIFDNATRDRVCLGYIRVTKPKPCYFCAMLASRGLQYRPYSEDAFAESDARFTGDGNAKVHDKCGCSLKAVYADNDPLVERTEEYADLWSRWGAGGGDAELRFRRGYEHWRKTGEYMTWEQANEGLRAA
jgi:hypothetical protein